MFFSFIYISTLHVDWDGSSHCMHLFRALWTKLLQRHFAYGAMMSVQLEHSCQTHGFVFERKRSKVRHLQHPAIVFGGFPVCLLCFQFLSSNIAKEIMLRSRCLVEGDVVLIYSVSSHKMSYTEFVTRNKVIFRAAAVDSRRLKLDLRPTADLILIIHNKWI